MTALKYLNKISEDQVAGTKGLFHIYEGDKCDTFVASLAERGPTISKPLILHVFKNIHYQQDRSMHLINELSGLHYYFKTVKQMFPVMNADENVYMQAKFTSEQFLSWMS